MPLVPQLTSRERRALRSHVMSELARLDAEVTAALDESVDAVPISDERDAMRTVLGRLDDLAFGVCDRCHGFVGRERLLALPTTTRCMACASNSYDISGP